MKILKILLPTMAIIFLFSCGQFGNPREEFAGDYKVRIKLDKDAIPEDAIQDTINLKMAEMKEKLNKAKIEIQDSIKLENIDTTTPEGKIEYAAKSFAKGITGLVGPLGELGLSLGEMGAGLAKGGAGMLGDMIGKLQFNVSLNPNGTISTDYDGINVFGIKNSTWDVEGDKLFLISQDNKKQEFKILGKKEGGFELKTDKATLVFDKQTGTK